MLKLKVVIGVPSGQTWNAKFGVCLVNLVSYFANNRVPGYDAQALQVVNTRSSILSMNRMNIVKQAQALQADYILFLDTDHTFPKELLHRLLSHREQVVAANCVTKSIPASPTARRKSEDPRGEVVYSDPHMDGLEQVWRVGTGVMLVDADIFQQLGHGCWEMQYRPEAETYQGEDWSFCAACEQAGIPIYVDHGTSQRIGHEGMMEYTHDLVGTLQE